MKEGQGKRILISCIYPKSGSSFTTKNTKGRENIGKNSGTDLLFYPEAHTHWVKASARRGEHLSASL